ncbi:MAG TPA: protein-disulfide reductase DsbD domain-containing protein, partial [Vicinamibacteria bacterium]|nr:protein-disulfide reductase DsbD domain-containing protein [Vicinamibacteria bacterium]
LRDPVSGAFHAEALDGAWRVATSEATLADNALLLRACALAHVATGEALFRDAAAGIARWALGMMSDPAGGFQAATWSDAGGAPARDPRVFAGANGLMIGALATSGARMDRAGDLEAARAAATAVIARLGPPAGLRRYALAAEAHGSAFLEDHAYLAEGLLDLAEATGDARWRREAQAVADAALARFFDPSGGGLFDTDARHDPRIVRTRTAFDGLSPAPSGVYASVLLRIAAATGEARYAELARGTVEAFLGDLEQAPRGMETMAEAAAELIGQGVSEPAAEAPLARREVRGPVAIEALLEPSRARRGAAVLGRVRLLVAGGWHVNAHRPGPKDLVGLAVSVPVEHLRSATPRYPEAGTRRRRFAAGEVAVHEGEVLVSVPMRVPARARPGATRVRFRVTFQACRDDDCRPPESVLLEAPLEVTP